MSSTTRRVVAICLAVGGLLFFAPAAIAQAVCGGIGQISGILTETIENPPAHAAPLGPLAAGVIANGARLAQATERGALFGGCGTLTGLAGEIVVRARSKVPVEASGVENGIPFIDLGVGAINGTFTVDTASGRIPGSLSGILDFHPTNHGVTDCGGPCPFVIAGGTWSTGGNSGLKGTFNGVALVPFACPALPSPTGFCYLDPTGVLTGGKPGVVPLNPVTDFDHFGNPAAKFIITLTD